MACKKTLRPSVQLTTWRSLAKTFDNIFHVDKRVEKSNVLTAAFRTTLMHDIKSFSPVLRLALGYFHGQDTLGVGTSTLRNSAAQALGCDSNAVLKSEQSTGDLADAVTSLWAQHHHHHHIHNHQAAEKEEELPKQQRQHMMLNIQDVAGGLFQLSQIHGADSNTGKENLIADLLSRCSSEPEVKYLMRTLQGQNKLRIGMGQSSIVGAAARAALCHTCDDNDDNIHATTRAEARSAEVLGRRVYFARHDLNRFAATLEDCYKLGLQKDMAAALSFCEEHTHPVPLVPVCAMLASPAKRVEEAVDYFVKSGEGTVAEIAVDYKYDGERALVHVVLDDDVPNTIHTNVYSRVGEDTSLRYQHVAQRVGELLQNHTSDLSSCILDGEMVAVDRATDRLLPFQALSRRTKDGSDNIIVDHPDTSVTDGEKNYGQSRPCDVCFYVFDVLECNGRSLINQSLRDRRELLSNIVKHTPGEMEAGREVRLEVGQGHSDAPAEIHVALEAAVKSGCEGLVVKALDGKGSWYRAGERTRNWLKLKKDYVDGVDGALDSFDLVLLAAYHGKGKRSGVYGSFLMGCMSESQQDVRFRTVCKVGTGFSDQILQEIYNDLHSDVVNDQKSTMHHHHMHTGNQDVIAHDFKIRPAPDVWFEPSRVWEVRAADISLSKVHDSCCEQLGDVEDIKRRRQGLALRFPRFIRYREDKSIPDATTETQLLDMYQQSSQCMN